MLPCSTFLGGGRGECRAELDTQQHCRDNGPCLSGQTIAVYCYLAIFLAATPFRLKRYLLSMFFVPEAQHNMLSVLSWSRCRCLEAKKLPRSQLCCRGYGGGGGHGTGERGVGIEPNQSKFLLNSLIIGKSHISPEHWCSY